MYEFENKVFRQQSYWINKLMIDEINKTITLELVANPDTQEIDGLISFTSVSNIHETNYDNDSEEYIATLLGIQNLTNSKGTRYIITTDVSEVDFISENEPLVKWIDPTKPKQEWKREIIKKI